jgi:hypothetical protein
MKQGYEYAQKKLGVEVVFGSTPLEEADVEQLNILNSWLAEERDWSLPVSGNFSQQCLDQG